MVNLLYRMTNKIFLVSDALAPLGLPDGVYPWDDRLITIKNGTARLPDGTLSGTTVPMIETINNLVKWQICEPVEAIVKAINAPRLAINMELNTTTQRLAWYQTESGQLTWQYR